MLWAVSCYFNPCDYKTRYKNFLAFRKNLDKQGVPLRLVELACGQFQTDADIKLKSNQFLWQKEALLNIAVQSLPADCTKVAWLDCDILFMDDDWHHKADKTLEDIDFIQPFEEGVWLSKTGIESTQKSCLFQFKNSPHFSLGHPHQGWPGLAFAGRRMEIYDKCILDGGDSVMMAAATKDFWVLDHWPLSWKSEIIEWCAKQTWTTGYLPGCVVHLWHGEQFRRSYSTRFSILNKHSFSPDQIKKSCDGIWVLENEALEKEIKKYFFDRREDSESLSHKILI